jgi:UDPglucose 6-dehydrogenase
MAKIGLIGWGVVGKAVGEGFAANPKNNVIWYDKYLKDSSSLEEVIESSEFIFVSVPTPMFHDDSGIDLSIMDEVVNKAASKMTDTNKVLIIKSTVIPGTTLSYANKYPKVKFAMNPEFLTEMNAPWDFLHPDRIVIGSEDEATALRIARLYRELSGYSVKIFITDTKTAEMVKYMSNTFMATKIIFANEMKELSEKLNINYDDVKKMVGVDPRIGESFLGVSPFKGFGLKCFPKDTVALLGLAKNLNVDLSLLKAVWEKNKKIRRIKDWEDIDGAVNFSNSNKQKKLKINHKYNGEHKYQELQTSQVTKS